MTTPREIELKFDLDPAAADALAKHPLFHGLPIDAVPAWSIYYDTAKSTLRKAGVTLRVRRSSDGFVQTVKADAKGGAGLFDRAEWETTLASGEPALALIDGTAAGPLLQGHDAQLRPLFETDIQRRRWTLVHDQAEIEILLDRGEIVAGKRRLAVAELELELRAGSAAALFALARQLNATIPLRLGVLTKSEQGYRLLRAKRAGVVKAEAITIDRGATAGDGFAAIAFACIRHLRLNEPRVLDARDAAALHQTRVALRRLRSAFTIFSPIVAGAESDTLRGELGWISAVLGEARDLDVFIGKDWAAKAGKTVGAHIAAERERAYDEAIAALDSQRFRGGMIDLAAWIATGSWRAVDNKARSQPLEAFAAAALDRFWKKVKKGGRELTAIDDEARHEVRIAGKKLRYATEFFDDLHDGSKRRKARRRFMAALEGMQADLGDLNDMVTARELSQTLSRRIGFDLDPGSIDGPAREKLLASAERAHARLVAQGPFWQ